MANICQRTCSGLCWRHASTRRGSYRVCQTNCQLHCSVPPSPAPPSQQAADARNTRADPPAAPSGLNKGAQEVQWRAMQVALLTQQLELLNFQSWPQLDDAAQTCLARYPSERSAQLLLFQLSGMNSSAGSTTGHSTAQQGTAQQGTAQHNMPPLLPSVLSHKNPGSYHTHPTLPTAVAAVRGAAAGCRLHSS